ncbi:hypothetical protein N9W79_00215 [bacterium]|nr:hypothetical protein [bacterium]
MKFLNTLITLSMTALVVSCGEIANEATERDVIGAITASDMFSDSEANGSVINDQLDDAISSLSQASSSSSSSSALMLADEEEVDAESEDSSTIENRKEHVVDRSCAAEEGVASVNIERSFEASFETSRGTIELEKSSSISRVWSHTSEDVECNSSNEYAAISDLKGDGLKLEAAFEKAKKRTVTRTRGTLTRESSASGTKSIEFISSTDDGSLETNQMLMTFDVARSASVEGKRKKRSYVSNSSAEELDVTVVRDQSSKEWESKTISSGSVSSTLENGIEILTSFDNVKFENTDSKCTPVSGIMSGSIKMPDSEDEVSFSIDFSEGLGTVSIGDEEEELDFDGCDLASI